MHQFYGQGTRNHSRLNHRFRGIPPPLTEPSAWYDFTDHKHQGYITLGQIMYSLNATCNPKTSVSENYIRKKAEEFWTNNNTNSMIVKDVFLRQGMNNDLQLIINNWDTMFKATRSEPVQQNEYHLNLLTSTYVPSTDGSSISTTSTKAQSRTNSTNASSLAHVPPLTKSREWFNYYDIDKAGILCKDDIIQALYKYFNAQTPSDKRKIKEDVSHIWGFFDLQSNGLIDIHAFSSRGGLGETLASMEQERNRQIQQDTNITRPLSSNQKNTFDAPAISNASAWFDFFDYDSDGSLTQKEVMHGMNMTLNANTAPEQERIKQSIAGIWVAYAGYSGVISKRDFVKKDGLADALKSMIQSWHQMSAMQHQQLQQPEVEEIEIQVDIPQGMQPGNLIRVCSPKTNELLTLSIPDRSYWGGNGSNADPFFFTILV